MASSQTHSDVFSMAPPQARSSAQVLIQPTNETKELLSFPSLGEGRLEPNDLWRTVKPLKSTLAWQLLYPLRLFARIAVGSWKVSWRLIGWHIQYDAVRSSVNAIHDFFVLGPSRMPKRQLFRVAAQIACAYKFTNWDKSTNIIWRPIGFLSVFLLGVCTVVPSRAEGDRVGEFFVKHMLGATTFLALLWRYVNVRCTYKLLRMHPLLPKIVAAFHLPVILALLVEAGKSIRARRRGLHKESDEMTNEERYYLRSTHSKAGNVEDDNGAPEFRTVVDLPPDLTKCIMSYLDTTDVRDLVGARNVCHTWRDWWDETHVKPVVAMKRQRTRQHYLTLGLALIVTPIHIAQFCQQELAAGMDLRDVLILGGVTYTVYEWGRLQAYVERVSGVDQDKIESTGGHALKAVYDRLTTTCKTATAFLSVGKGEGNQSTEARVFRRSLIDLLSMRWNMITRTFLDHAALQINSLMGFFLRLQVRWFFYPAGWWRLTLVAAFNSMDVGHYVHKFVNGFALPAIVQYFPGESQPPSTTDSAH